MNCGKLTILYEELERALHLCKQKVESNMTVYSQETLVNISKLHLQAVQLLVDTRIELKRCCVAESLEKMLELMNRRVWDFEMLYKAAGRASASEMVQELLSVSEDLHAAVVKLQQQLSV